MSDIMRFAGINEDPRPEILFAVKERVAVLAGGSGEPVRLDNIIVRNAGGTRRDFPRFYEVTNVFIDDSGCLCGDLVSRKGKRDADAFFGISIEDLETDDLVMILDALFNTDCVIDRAYFKAGASGRRPGVTGFFTGLYDGFARTLRKNA